MLELFDDIFDLPDPEKARQFNALVGLDEEKERLIKEGCLLLNPQLLDEWSKKHHGTVLPAVTHFHHRPPLLVFAGDVGTGKTTLANSFGDSIARAERIAVRVLRLSLITRGTGAVGEMTRLISSAFQQATELTQQNTKTSRKPTLATVLIIDEADALAQSREFDQMHHEDRAGVNALIRGIDQLSIASLPIIVVMCTNRIEALDPAILRRAAALFVFNRPTPEQRAEILIDAFKGIFTDDEMQRLVELTGPNGDLDYGYTYSDLTQRFIPALLLHAFPDSSLTFELAAQVTETVKPTKPFRSQAINF